jgi:hypothetical protein
LKKNLLKSYSNFLSKPSQIRIRNKYAGSDRAKAQEADTTGSGCTRLGDANLALDPLLHLLQPGLLLLLDLVALLLYLRVTILEINIYYFQTIENNIFVFLSCFRLSSQAQ